MKFLKKTLLFLTMSICLIMSGCQNNKESSNSAPITFFEISDGLDGEGTQVIEWGEDHKFNDDVYFKVRDGIDINELKVIYQYNPDNVGKIQKMTIKVEYKGNEYKKSYPILIDDTKAPEIKFNGETKITINNSYDISKYIEVIDMKGNKKEKIYNCDQLNKFYKGYIIVYVLAGDDEKYKEALQANMGNQLNNESLGNYKIIIRASDGHGNITTHVEDLELVDELLYQ